MSTSNGAMGRYLRPCPRGRGAKPPRSPRPVRLLPGFPAKEKRMRRGWGCMSRRIAGLFCLCVLTVMVATGGGGDAFAAAPKQGGTLTVPVDQEFRGFDPLKAAYLQFGDHTVMMAVEERLFDMDAKGRLVPELALSATPSEEGTTWTIKLRQGVSFHDGTPFNAD